MSKEIKSYEDLKDAIDQISQNYAETRSGLRNLGIWVRDNKIAKDVFTPQRLSQVEEALSKIHKGLSSIEQSTENLIWHFFRNSMDKFLAGQRLEREEFYFLEWYKNTISTFEIDSMDPYEEFSHHYYEDNEKNGYIDPSEIIDTLLLQTDNGGGTQIDHQKLGIAPEEVRTSFLRPDQKDFLREFEPDLFSRFKKD